MSTTRRRVAFDLVLAACCVAGTVLLQVTGADAVAANRPPDAWSVLLSVVAVAPLALRRRWPLPVLAVCYLGLWGLIAGRWSVGAAPVGLLIGFYTVVAWDSRRNARLAVAVVVVGDAIALLMRPVDLSAEGAVVEIALLVACWIVGTGTRQRRELHASQVAAAQRQAEQAATDERLRITRELHDVLGHAFSVMVVQAGVAEHLIDSDPDEARKALAEIGTLGRGSLAEMRRLLTVLRSDSSVTRAPAPTLADVPALVERVSAAGLPVSLDVHGTPAGALPPGVEVAAYRVIQEALTNCIKHSGGSHASVRLTHEGGTVAIEVTDDGPAPTGPPGPGQGIAGMRERVAMYGGSLSAGPTPAGYVVRASLPVVVS